SPVSEVPPDATPSVEDTFQNGIGVTVLVAPDMGDPASPIRMELWGTIRVYHKGEVVDETERKHPQEPFCSISFDPEGRPSGVSSHSTHLGEEECEALFMSRCSAEKSDTVEEKPLCYRRMTEGGFEFFFPR